MRTVSVSVAGRLFNEKEVTEILRRASSIRSGGGLADSGGITLAELQQTGAELGFDPTHIELAARQLGATAPSSPGYLGPRIVMDRTVDGELSPDDWQGMVGVMQRYHKASGAVSERAGNYDWAGSEEGASLALTVNVRNGRTRIRLESNRWMGLVMAPVFCSVFALVISLSVAKHGYPLAALPICLAFGAVLFCIARLFRNNHVQSVAGLLERLVAEVQPAATDRNLENASRYVGETEPAVQQVQN